MTIRPATLRPASPHAGPPRRVGALLALCGSVVSTVALRGSVGTAAAARPAAPAPALGALAPVIVRLPGPVRTLRATPVVIDDPRAGALTTTGPTSRLPLAPAGPVAPPGAAPTGRRTIQGDALVNKYGTVQVALVLQGTQIVDVRTLQSPDDHQRSRDINAAALPVLREHVLRAQSAQIQGVSGATYTWESYVLSVQSALDQA